MWQQLKTEQGVSDVLKQAMLQELAIGDGPVGQADFMVTLATASDMLASRYCEGYLAKGKPPESCPYKAGQQVRFYGTPGNFRIEHAEWVQTMPGMWMFFVYATDHWHKRSVIRHADYVAMVFEMP